MKFDIPNNNIFPITNLNNPEVWIEYHRLIISRNNDDFTFRGQVALIDSCIPDGCKVRNRFNEDKTERIWEYLM